MSRVTFTKNITQIMESSQPKCGIRIKNIEVKVRVPFKSLILPIIIR